MVLPRASYERIPDQQDNARILSVSPAEEGVLPPVTISCGNAQIQQHIELPSIETSKTLMSLSLLLAIEQRTCPTLDVATLKAELAANGNLIQAMRRAPGNFEGSEAHRL